MYDYSKLLDEVSLTDLSNENAYDLAECIGIEAFRNLINTYSGSGTLYIPTLESIIAPIRNRHIQNDYFDKKVPISKISQQYRMSERYVFAIISDDFRYSPVRGRKKGKSNNSKTL